MAKTTYMIAHGASVVIVRDGTRKTVPAGSGEHFTDDEITAVTRAAPGSLRKPVNEAPAVSEDADETEAAETVTTEKSGKGGAKGKKAAKPAKPAADDDDGDI